MLFWPLFYIFSLAQNWLNLKTTHLVVERFICVMAKVISPIRTMIRAFIVITVLHSAFIVKEWDINTFHSTGSYMMRVTHTHTCSVIVWRSCDIFHDFEILVPSAKVNVSSLRNKVCKICIIHSLYCQNVLPFFFLSLFCVEMITFSMCCPCIAHQVCLTFIHPHYKHRKRIIFKWTRILEGRYSKLYQER